MKSTILVLILSTTTCFAKVAQKPTDTIAPPKTISIQGKNYSPCATSGGAVAASAVTPCAFKNNNNVWVIIQ